MDDLFNRYPNFLLIANKIFASSVLESNEKATVSIESVLEIEEIPQTS